MAKSTNTILLRSFDDHERACMLRLLSESDNPDQAAAELRQMLFRLRLRLDKDGIDYYSLSNRIAYHFHKDREGMSARLSR
jgi:hypothetical protein